MTEEPLIETPHRAPASWITDYDTYVKQLEERLDELRSSRAYFYSSVERELDKILAAHIPTIDDALRRVDIYDRAMNRVDPQTSERRAQELSFLEVRARHVKKQIKEIIDGLQFIKLQSGEPADEPAAEALPVLHEETIDAFVQENMGKEYVLPGGDQVRIADLTHSDWMGQKFMLKTCKYAYLPVPTKMKLFAVNDSCEQTRYLLGANGKVYEQACETMVCAADSLHEFCTVARDPETMETYKEHWPSDSSDDTDTDDENAEMTIDDIVAIMDPEGSRLAAVKAVQARAQRGNHAAGKIVKAIDTVIATGRVRRITRSATRYVDSQSHMFDNMNEFF